MKAAIVGCGGIARVHAESISILQEHKLVAFADIKKERAKSFSETYGGRAYESLEAMLDQEEIDVLHVCTPHYLHVPMTVLALSKGIHVYQEKPAAISLEQYKELGCMVQKSGARFGISFQNRYNACVVRAKELIESGKAGKVLGGKAFVTWKRDEEYYKGSDWRGRLATEGGGCLINQSVHTLDLLVTLLGRPIEVEAEIFNHHLKESIEVEDTVEAYITFETKEGKCCGNFYATNSFCTDSIPIIEVVCENMILRIEDPSLTIIYPNSTWEHAKLQKGNAAIGKRYWGNGHEKAIREFYGSVENKTEFLLDFKNTDTTNRLMFAIYKSAEEGRKVFLEEI